MNEARINQDYFGFLPHKWTINFDGGTISPVSEFDEAAAWINKCINEDGFLYPPTVHRIEVDSFAMKYLERIPKTERPAHLWRIPPSHELNLFASDTPDQIRKGPGSFIIHVLSYLFGVRLQFCDWWLDGRVPIQAKEHSIIFTENVAEDFLSRCYGTWKSWPENEQKLISNLLFMHSRVPSYEWDWERFFIEYMVLDGCYKFGKSLHLVGEAGFHGDRVRILCQTFEIPINDNFVREIVRLRNQLFHETLWDRSQPCTAASRSAFILAGHLRRLNQRLIPALFGYKTPYVQTEWWFLGNYSFGPAGK